MQKIFVFMFKHACFTCKKLKAAEGVNEKVVNEKVLPVLQPIKGMKEKSVRLNL